jgi:DNA-binding transcriptional MerR regulator
MIEQYITATEVNLTIGRLKEAGSRIAGAKQALDQSQKSPQSQPYSGGGYSGGGSGAINTAQENLRGAESELEAKIQEAERLADRIRQAIGSTETDRADLESRVKEIGTQEVVCGFRDAIAAKAAERRRLDDFLRQLAEAMRNAHSAGGSGDAGGGISPYISRASAQTGGYQTSSGIGYQGAGTQGSGSIYRSSRSLDEQLTNTPTAHRASGALSGSAYVGGGNLLPWAGQKITAQSSQSDYVHKSAPSPDPSEDLEQKLRAEVRRTLNGIKEYLRLGFGGQYGGGP